MMHLGSFGPKFDQRVKKICPKMSKNLTYLKMPWFFKARHGL